MSFAARSRKRAEISSGIENGQVLIFDIPLKVPAHGGGLLQYIHWIFVGADKDAFFVALQPLDKKLQGEDRFSRTRFSGNENRAALGKTAFNEGIQSENSRGYAFGL